MSPPPRRRRRVALVATLALACVLALAALRSRNGRSSDLECVILHRPDAVPDGSELGRAMLALRSDAPVPSGLCLLRFVEPNGSLGWSGRRRHAVELRAPPDELVSVTLHRDGATERRIEGAGRTELRLPIEVPFWGDHDYVLTVELSGGELSPFDFELFGTLSAGSTGVAELGRAWRSLVQQDG